MPDLSTSAYFGLGEKELGMKTQRAETMSGPFALCVHSFVKCWEISAGSLIKVELHSSAAEQ